ncbi:hypothetical protein F5148DRAFT_1154828 [Russula earlei]|uniref:Uncharacterized protein n=1 Tax=Russula earlei TaxID=71964 RepID=A0ACC0TSE4_9AGAM|nr:hypothetical protein F5148DRAFT_1154828 [Russula earlei]
MPWVARTSAQRRITGFCKVRKVLRRLRANTGGKWVQKKASIAGQWAVRVIPQQRPTHMCHRDGRREKGNGPLNLEVKRVSMALPSRGSQRDGILPPNYDRLQSLSISQVYRVFCENDTKGVWHQLRSATCQRLPSQANGQDSLREKGNGPLDLEALRESAWHRLHKTPREMVYWVFRENNTKGVRHQLCSATYQRLPSQAMKGRHRWHNISCTAHRTFVLHGRRIHQPGTPTSDRTPATLCDVPKGFHHRPMGSEGGPSTASHAYVSQRWPPGEKEWSS